MQEAVFKAIICVNALFLRDATNCCVTFSVLLCYGYNRNNMELEIWRNQFKVMGKQGANHECNRQKYKKIEKRTEAVSKTAGGAAPCDAAGGIQLGNRKNQPDIEMLEAIAKAFDTDLYMILYGRKINEESGESVSKRKKYHLYTALICGAVVLAAVISWIILKDKVMELRRLYYNMVPYFIFYLLVRPVTFFAGGAGLMHLLGLLADFSVRRAWIRRTILFFSAGILLLYVVAVLSMFIPGFPMQPLRDYLNRMRFSYLPSYMASSPVVFLLSGLGMCLGTQDTLRHAGYFYIIRGRRKISASPTEKSQ